jgi:hypothetical protein
MKKFNNDAENAILFFALIVGFLIIGVIGIIFLSRS